MKEDFFEETREREREPEGSFFKVVKVVFAIAAILGMVYLSGFQQYFFFFRTLPSVRQESIETVLDAELIKIPLAIYILEGGGEAGSERSNGEVLSLVQNTSKIWEQASISLYIKSLERLNMSDSQIKKFLDSPIALAPKDPESINVFLVRRLNGINGVTYMGLRSLAVADFTTVFDFRVLAHEVGHILGLGHVLERGRLMHQGVNAVKLSLEEINTARDSALLFSQ